MTLQYVTIRFHSEWLKSMFSMKLIKFKLARLYNRCDRFTPWREILSGSFVRCIKLKHLIFITFTQILRQHDSAGFRDSDNVLAKGKHWIEMETAAFNGHKTSWIFMMHNHTFSQYIFFKDILDANRYLITENCRGEYKNSVWRKLCLRFCRKGLGKMDSRFQYNRYRGYRHYFVFKVSSCHR